jgi:hypothetical protein
LGAALRAAGAAFFARDAFLRAGALRAGFAALRAGFAALRVGFAALRVGFAALRVIFFGALRPRFRLAAFAFRFAITGPFRSLTVYP